MSEEKERFKDDENENENERSLFGEFDLSNRNLGCQDHDKDHDSTDTLSVDKCKTCEKANECFIKGMLTAGVKELSDRHSTFPLRVVASKSYAVEAIMNLLLDDASQRAKCDLLTLCALLFKSISILDGFEMKVKALEYVKNLEDAEENSPYGFCHSAEEVADALCVTKEQVKEAGEETTRLIESLVVGKGDEERLVTRGGTIAAIKASTEEMSNLFYKHLEVDGDLTVKSLIIANFLRKIYMGTIAFKLTT